ncbi:UbiA family prenyltransferase [Micromonospora echinofusca]|uniref:Ubiquinone biosynthesis protein UbiA n=1 Tax=Micromonospora echinofusca TaxID=47858 RepID=A0ABS3VS29_MICEH|nr:UbiA family prenyltransferase [Micromonospora echinofusca]MBO4207340.1 ubiquinone biosynthesis protein UbiA [Micromonospora echinofusca]
MTATAGRPGVLRAHVQTWRPYTLWYIGLVGLAGAGLAGDRPSWWRLLAAWATPTIGWIGGHYLSDWFDRRLDAVSKPHRPIPSGVLPATTALVCGGACLVAVGTLSAAASWPTVAVAVLAAAAIVAYGRRLKAHGLAGNLVRGALGALTLLYGAAVVAPPVPWSLLPFVVAFWAHDTSSNLVGTLRDIAGDRAGGYRTVPVRHGTPVAVHTALGLYAVAFVAAVLGGYATGDADRRTGYLVALLPAAGLAGVAFRSLLRHRDRMPMAVALRAHELLVLERVWLAATVVGLGFGLLPAVGLVVPALLVTWWTQRHLRTGYEFGPSRAAPDATGPGVPLPRRPSDLG